jgi:GT2 family glycosyltransferase
MHSPRDVPEASRPAPTSGPLSPQRLCAIVVTYGERHHLLTQVLERLATLDVRAVVAVFNGNYHPQALATKGNVVIVEHLGNFGSAGGFRAGIEAALRLDADYFLLLDDDNLPAPDCLNHLCISHAALGNDPLTALQAFRPSQPWQCVTVRDGIVPIGRPNTYGWFNFVNERYLLRRQLGRGGSPYQPDSGTARVAPNPLVRIDVAAYGGLLISRAALLLSEQLPDVRYFCYYDDFDFTSRLVRRGVKIYLCANAIIEDLDTSWHARNERAHPAFSPRTSDFRIYLDLRNAMIFNRSRVNNRCLYYLNAIGFWLGIGYLAIFRSANIRTTFRRLGLMVRAVVCGSRGDFRPLVNPEIQ